MEEEPAEQVPHTMDGLVWKPWVVADNGCSTQGGWVKLVEVKNLNSGSQSGQIVMRATVQCPCCRVELGLRLEMSYSDSFAEVLSRPGRDNGQVKKNG